MAATVLIKARMSKEARMPMGAIVLIGATVLITAKEPKGPDPRKQ